MIILGVCLLLASHRVLVHTILKANISNGNGEGNGPPMHPHANIPESRHAGRPESTDRGARYTAALRLQAHAILL